VIFKGEKDAESAQTSGAGDAGVAGNGESKGPIDSLVGFIDADAGGHKSLGHSESVITDLKLRLGIGQIESIVAGAQNAHGLAEAAGAGGQLAGQAFQWTGAVPSQSAVVGHLF
jgi:hypothetical protein